MKYTYLLIDLGALFVPLLFSFHPKIRFDRQWYSFFVSCFIAAVLFITWDILFMRMDIWGFNPKYIVGIYLAGLPLEEIMFFICIPYACVFTYYCLDSFFDLRWKKSTEEIFSWLLIASLVVTGTIYISKWYTAVTFLSAAAIIVFLRYVAKVDWFGKFITVYVVLLLPFFIVNGMLTGSGIGEAVVFYNNAENTGLRILTIPVEDIIYGFELILLNVFLFEMMRYHALKAIYFPSTKY